MGSRQWPLLAVRMDQIRDHGGTALLGAHLARLGTDTSWKDGLSSTTVGRLVDATLHSLTTPPSAPAAPASRVRVPGGGPLPLHDHASRRGPRTSQTRPPNPRSHCREGVTRRGLLDANADAMRGHRAPGDIWTHVLVLFEIHRRIRNTEHVGEEQLALLPPLYRRLVEERWPSIAPAPVAG